MDRSLDIETHALGEKAQHFYLIDYSLKNTKYVYIIYIMYIE